MPQARMRQFSVALRALLEGDRAMALAAIEDLLVNTTRGPEGLYFLARYLARLGEIERANDVLASAVAGGFDPRGVMAIDPWLESLRGSPAFAALADEAEARYRAAVAAFTDAGGEHVLGAGSGR